MSVHVTRHAIERFRERVENLPEEQIRARLSTPAIRKLAMFAGCHQIEVILGSGHHAVIKDATVVTIRPLEKPRRRKFRRMLDSEAA